MPSDSRYTRIVSWQRRIAIVVLTVLVGLPVGGTVCATVCDSASGTKAAHHDSGQKCEEPAKPTEPQMTALSGHDCSVHNAAVRLIATAAERADATAKRTPAITSTVYTASVRLPPFQSVFDDIAPPGTAPPTATSCILRV